MSNGKIYVVGIGPGNMEDISIRAYNILKNIKYCKIIDHLRKMAD